MKAYIGKVLVSIIFLFAFAGLTSFAQNQQQDPPDFEELAEKEADRLAELLDLNDYQLFYVDSTLKHDIVAMNEELAPLRAQNVMNSSLYYIIQDKWMDAIDASYRKIFDDKQWDAYLKSGAAREQKARAKRKEKAEKALDNLQ